MKIPCAGGLVLKWAYFTSDLQPPAPLRVERPWEKQLHRLPEVHASRLQQEAKIKGRSGGIAHRGARIRVQQRDQLRRNGAHQDIDLPAFDQYCEFIPNDSNSLLNNPIQLV